MLLMSDVKSIFTAYICDRINIGAHIDTNYVTIYVYYN